MIQKKSSLCILMIMLAITIPALASAAPAITVGSVNIPVVGEDATIPVVLTGIETGVAGYQIQVSSSVPEVAMITGVDLPDWSIMSEVTESFPASVIDVTAVDLEKAVSPGTTEVELFSFSVQAVGEGDSEFSLFITELTDDDGNAVPATLTPGIVHVGEGTATAEPTQAPVTQPQEPVTEPQEPVTEPQGSTEPEVQGSGVIQALFTYVPPNTGFAPLKVQFVDLSTGLPDKFVWDFGDGETFVTSAVNGTVVENPTHIYRAAGTYSVTLTASNTTESNSHTEKDIIVVTDPNVPGKKATGSIQMNSHPQGAEFYINGALMGVTPITVTDLRPDSYQVRLKMDGFRDWVRAYDVGSGPYPSCRTTVAMQPIHQGYGQHNVSEYPEGSAYIVSQPENVTVYVDNQKMGVTDLMMTNLLPGEHTITLERSGFANWTDSITIEETRTTMQVYTYEEPYYKKVTSLL